MPVSPFSATRLICERGSWQVTNLALQKILYLTHMVYLGRTGAPLITSPFEAWEYGPVVPEVYRKVRMFGAEPIRDIFFGAPSIDGTPEAETLVEGCSRLLTKRPGELVAMTHWEHGAWAKNYIAGARGVPIPNEDIMREYRLRTQG